MTDAQNKVTAPTLGLCGFAHRITTENHRYLYRRQEQDE